MSTEHVHQQGESGAVTKVIIANDGSEHSEYALECYTQNVQGPQYHVTLDHIPELNEMLHSSRWAYLESSAGRVVSPSSIMMHHGFRSKDARRERRQIHRLGQATSHFLTVGCPPR